MIYEILHRRRFHDLVEKLRKQGNLDEKKLNGVLEFRRGRNVLSKFLSYGLGVPSLLYFSFLLFKALFYEDSLDNADKLSMAILFCFMSIALYIHITIHIFDWRYVSLMTNGIYADGTVLRFTFDLQFGQRYCEYYFFDEVGDKHISKMQIPITFDPEFDYKKGDKIKVAYDICNPKRNIVASPKMKMFNIRLDKEGIDYDTLPKEEQEMCE